jgi:diaminohydroxyphosphoribosylaminopyrimidine deaminase / 5-amino-6-(5-phosphoribosylamino)uracil reductase
MNNPDQLFMQRALELATLGRGNVSPNPMVGCVIVHNNRIIGEGWHKRCGEAHAEVNAIEAVQEKSLLSEATAYVTLEPCSHFGKTPPCADLLIKHQLKKVIICNEDPFDLVAGKGIEKLKNAGIGVEIGLLASEGREINKRFFTLIEKKRPHIVLKWAETADGFIAQPNGKPLQISGDLAQKYVHKWRSEEDAIMVGTNTAINDNPRLNTRFWTGKSPIRVVIDRHLKLPSDAHLLDNFQRTIVFNLHKETTEKANEYIKLPNENQLNFILEKLYELKIQSILVEGGTQLLQNLMDENLFDELRIFKSRNVLKEGILGPKIPRSATLASTQFLENDTLSCYVP